MKGSCGELRRFKCRDCHLLISKFFSFFEKPENFRIVECDECHGKADWVEDQEVGLNRVSEDSVYRLQQRAGGVTR